MIVSGVMMNSARGALFGAVAGLIGGTNSRWSKCSTCSSNVEKDNCALGAATPEGGSATCGLVGPRVEQEQYLRQGVALVASALFGRNLVRTDGRTKVCPQAFCASTPILIGKLDQVSVRKFPHGFL